MGLLTDADTPLDEFVHQANALCPTHILDLSQLGRNYDNSVFYASLWAGWRGAWDWAPTAPAN